MTDFEQMRRDWWVRRAILHMFSHVCFCPQVLNCITCDQLKEAEEHFPVQYSQALQIKKETENGIQSR